MWTFTHDSCGYMLYLDGKPMGGAGTMGTASHTADGRVRHWETRRADIAMYKEQAESRCNGLNSLKATNINGR